MKLTNAHNLPEPFVIAASYDGYDGGTSKFSTTGLLNPPRILALKRKHKDDIEIDVADTLYRMTGSMRHLILERIAKANPERYVTEQRLYSTVDGISISGQIDLYDKQDKTLYDYKECSVWKAKIVDTEDWSKQGNINKFHCTNNGIEVKKLVNIAMFRDWKLRDAKHDRNYPQCAVQAFELEFWTQEKTLAFIKERLKLHTDAEKVLPECTPEERWEKPTRYAIIKAGRKTAVRVYDSQPLAEAHMKSVDAKHSIQIRPGEMTRCSDWCEVSDFCSFWQANKPPEAAEVPLENPDAEAF